jgi:hypothetical protein
MFYKTDYELLRGIEDQCLGPQLKGEELRLLRPLLMRVTPIVDARVGRYLAAPKHTRAEWPQLGEQARKDVTAAIHSADEKALRATAQVAVLGALVTFKLLADLSGDSYLMGWWEALQQHRFGPHPWFRPPKARVRPPQYADAVLHLRAIPFWVIEYLVASDAYPTKTRAQEKVIERLGRPEDTLREWRKAQNKLRRADFAIELQVAASFGKAASMFRMLAKEDPTSKEVIDRKDQILGLPAVDRCAAALRALGADKGRKA